MRKLVLALALFGCSGEPLPPVHVPEVPPDLLCKLNVLTNLPQDPEEIDYLIIQGVVRAVRGCTIIHLPDAGQ
jgi:hypothetical protein